MSIFSILVVNFLIHLLFGALFIVGFFSITRGFLELMPDGSLERRGKIFMGWFFFWYKEKGKRKIYYINDELIKIVGQMRSARPDKRMSVNYGPKTESMLLNGPLDEYLLADLENRLSVKFELDKTYAPVHKAADEFGYTVARVYKELPIFVFPWYLRDMMAGCITCHSSWLGSIMFWVPFLLFKGCTIYEELHLITGYYVFALLFIWVSYCISLAFIVTAFWKKYM